MKEASFEDMSLPRLLELQKIWEAQAKSAHAAGHNALAISLIQRIDKLQPLIEKRRQDNLNDLFA